MLIVHLLCLATIVVWAWNMAEIDTNYERDKKRGFDYCGSYYE